MITVGPIGRGRLPEVARVMNAAFGAGYARFLPARLSQQETAGDWRRAIREMAPPAGRWFGALDGGRLIGAAVVSPSCRAEPGDIHRVGVMPGYEGRGVAAAMMRAIIAQYPHRRLELCVVRGNARAIALYQRLGFRLTGRRFLFRWTSWRSVECEMMARAAS